MQRGRTFRVETGMETVGGNQEVHTTVHDREEEYPYHIVRYTKMGTVAPPSSSVE